MPRANDDTSAGAPAARTRFSARAIGVLALVAVIIYVIDRVAKTLIVANLSLGEQVPVLGELLQLHYVKNPGAAFSIGAGSTWIFAIIATAVVIFIVLFARRIRSAGWAVLFGLLLGGNTGNLTDRLTGEEGFGVGHVVDFLQLYGFNAIFNVADMAIVFSMVIFVVLTVRGVRLDGTRQPKAARKAGTDAVAGTASEPAPLDTPLDKPLDTETRP